MTQMRGGPDDDADEQLQRFMVQDQPGWTDGGLLRPGDIITIARVTKPKRWALDWRSYWLGVVVTTLVGMVMHYVQ